MARSNERTSSRRGPKDAARRTKKKPCALCKDKVEWVDYKDVGMLRKYMSDRGKIRARRVTGNCAQHQREIALAIKTARELVVLPYTQRTTTERSGGRGRGRGGPGGGYGGPRAPRAEGGNGAGERQGSGGDQVEGPSGNGDGSVGEPGEGGSENGAASGNGSGSEAEAFTGGDGEGGDGEGGA